MEIEYHILWHPMRGKVAAEYEDRARADPAVGRFAIADGATESAYADLWAEFLVTAFVEGSLDRENDVMERLRALQQSWMERVSGPSLPWYAEAKIAQGAYSTFLGLHLEPANGCRGGRWRSFAVGDSCLFHVRDGRLRRAFPLSSATEFGDSPMLIGSRTPPQQLVDRNRWRFRTGRWLPGDRFWLLTDALAQWFLERLACDVRPWEHLERFVSPASEDGFAAWIESLRDRREIRNDDVTLLVVKL
jgi:Protein phosphatase 2C